MADRLCIPRMIFPVLSRKPGMLPWLPPSNVVPHAVAIQGEQATNTLMLVAHEPRQRTNWHRNAKVGGVWRETGRPGANFATHCRSLARARDEELCRGGHGGAGPRLRLCRSAVPDQAQTGLSQ